MGWTYEPAGFSFVAEPMGKNLITSFRTAVVYSSSFVLEGYFLMVSAVVARSVPKIRSCSSRRRFITSGCVPRSAKVYCDS